MHWFNFHRTERDQLEVLVNAHVMRGYRLHGVYYKDKYAEVRFVKDLPQEDWQAKFEACVSRARDAEQGRAAEAEAKQAAGLARSLAHNAKQAAASLAARAEKEAKSPAKK